MALGKTENSGLLVVCAAALVDGTHRVLVQKRPETGNYAGLWEFPGGKMEWNESPAAALARELYEELGIEVALADLEPLAFSCSDGPDNQILLLLFVSRTWSGTPRALHADAIDWVDMHQLSNLSMPPADIPLLADVARFLES